MLNVKHKGNRSFATVRATAPLGRPGARMDNVKSNETVQSGRENLSSRNSSYGTSDLIISRSNAGMRGLHPLTDSEMNSRLYRYECDVKSSFDDIESALLDLNNLKLECDYEMKTREHMRRKLGIDIPGTMFADSISDKADMYVRKLYAWCLFDVYQKYCTSFAKDFPFVMDADEFQSLIQSCGFHTFDVSPCADGRLAHVISYVLRLNYRNVRRKSYAGAMFDVEDTLNKWVETELIRFREGIPDTSDSQTRYLKSVVYHFSSRFPDQEGCAAHGSNADVAAQAGRDRLYGFKQAVENTYCCGASVDQLLIGLDTDNDAIRIHVPDKHGQVSLTDFVDANEIYHSTYGMSEYEAKNRVADIVKSKNPQMPDGLVKFISFLLINNISQIDYVRSYHGGCYSDIGHAERFIGVGKGFEEVQLRNLTFFSYLKTVEESVKDLDVGVKIFKGLNVGKGLSIPVVVRFDYHGTVPGARERAIEHCYRVNEAIMQRYETLVAQGLLYVLMVIKDVKTTAPLEKLEYSAQKQVIPETH